MKRTFQFIGSYIGIGFMYLLSFLPHFVLYALSDLAYLIAYKLLKYRLKVVNSNLINSFPEKDEEEILRIQDAFYKNLMDIMVETVKEFSISKKQMQKRYRFINPEEFHKHFDNQKSVMMLMGHYGNWEYGVSTPLWVKHDCWAVYGKLQNKVMDKEIVRVRERFGHKLFDMGKTYDVMLSHEQGDKLYMFMADQSPHKGSIKYWLNFLNQDTPVHLGAEKLSKMLDLAVVFIDIQRVKRGYYEIEARTLFDAPKQTEDHEIIDKYFEVLEEVIRKKPENWLWSHKRWKYSREDVENYRRQKELLKKRANQA